MSFSNSSFQQLSVKRLCNKNGIIGAAGQFLRSNGSEIDWGNGAGGSGLFVEQITTQDGLLNNYNLTSNCVVLNCLGQAAAFSGFTVNNSSVQGGDIVIILNNSPSYVRLLNQSTSSSVPNRIVCSSGSGQFIGSGGSAQCIYDSASSRWICSLINFGKPIQIPFDSATYNTEGDGDSSIAITEEDVLLFSFVQNGCQLMIQHAVGNVSLTSALSGNVSNIEVLYPYGFVALPGSVTIPNYIYKDTNELGLVTITSGSIQIRPVNELWVEGDATINNVQFEYSVIVNIL